MEAILSERRYVTDNRQQTKMSEKITLFL